MIREQPDAFLLELPDGREIRVRLSINPRATRVSVRIDPRTREPVATAPRSRDIGRAAAFAADRADWIIAALERMPKFVPFEPGGRVLLRGESHVLVHAEGRGACRIMDGRPPQLIVPAPDGHAFPGRVRRMLQKEAERDVTLAVKRYAGKLGLRHGAIRIKDAASRWGSCNAEGDLAFSWRLILAPPFVLDYVAAHEVAHLKEMNHSARFWALVRAAYGESRKAKDWLRRHGHELHAYGRVPADGL